MSGVLYFRVFNMAFDEPGEVIYFTMFTERKRQFLVTQNMLNGFMLTYIVRLHQVNLQIYVTLSNIWLGHISGI